MWKCFFLVSRGKRTAIDHSYWTLQGPYFLPKQLNWGKVGVQNNPVWFELFSFLINFYNLLQLMYIVVRKWWNTCIIISLTFFVTDCEKGSTSRGRRGGGILLSCEEKLAAITIHRSWQDKKNKRPCVSFTFPLGISVITLLQGLQDQSAC